MQIYNNNYQQHHNNTKQRPTKVTLSHKAKPNTLDSESDRSGADELLSEIPEFLPTIIL